MYERKRKHIMAESVLGTWICWSKDYDDNVVISPSLQYEEIREKRR